MNRQGLVLAAALLAALTQPAWAHECPECSDAASTSFWPSDWKLSWYAGLSYQFGEFEEWGAVSRVDSGSFTSRSEDDRDTGYGLTAGMGFLEHFGVEASYADFGEAHFTGQSNGLGTYYGPGAQRDSLRLGGYALRLVGRVPVAGGFFLSGKAGWWYWHAQQHVSGTSSGGPYDDRQSDSGLQFSWGAALDYDGLRPVRLSAEYGSAKFEAPITDPLFGASEIHCLSLSLQYLF